jgi:hypothetical protein
VTELVALDAYQWPPSSEALAKKYGVDPRSVLRDQQRWRERWPT